MGMRGTDLIYIAAQNAIDNVLPERQIKTVTRGWRGCFLMIGRDLEPRNKGDG